MTIRYLHLHPDGMVAIRTDDEQVVYAASLADFASDYGAAFPMPPALDGRPIVELELYLGEVFAYDRQSNQIDVNGQIDPAPYQAILDAADRLAAVAQLRAIGKLFQPRGLPRKQWS